MGTGCSFFHSYSVVESVPGNSRCCTARSGAAPHCPLRQTAPAPVGELQIRQETSNRLSCCAPVFWADSSYGWKLFLYAKLMGNQRALIKSWGRSRRPAPMGSPTPRTAGARQQRASNGFVVSRVSGSAKPTWERRRALLKVLLLGFQTGTFTPADKLKMTHFNLWFNQNHEEPNLIQPFFIFNQERPLIF